MLAHAKKASAGYPNIIIKSLDTDGFTIALNASLSIRADLYFNTGTKDKRRIISISKVRENLGDLWSAALIGFHSFTGIKTKKNNSLIFLFKVGIPQAHFLGRESLQRLKL